MPHIQYEHPRTLTILPHPPPLKTRAILSLSKSQRHSCHALINSVTADKRFVSRLPRSQRPKQQSNNNKNTPTPPPPPPRIPPPRARASASPTPSGSQRGVTCLPSHVALPTVASTKLTQGLRPNLPHEEGCPHLARKMRWRWGRRERGSVRKYLAVTCHVDVNNHSTPAADGAGVPTQATADDHYERQLSGKRCNFFQDIGEQCRGVNPTASPSTVITPFYP